MHFLKEMSIPPLCNALKESRRTKGSDQKVNPVRRFSTFQREGSYGALNPVFAPKGILSSTPLQAAGLSNGVNVKIRRLKNEEPRQQGGALKCDFSKC